MKSDSKRLRVVVVSFFLVVFISVTGLALPMVLATYNYDTYYAYRNYAYNDYPIYDNAYYNSYNDYPHDDYTYHGYPYLDYSYNIFARQYYNNFYANIDEVQSGFIFDAVYSSPGEEVDVTVSLLGNPGIAGFSLRVYFDYRVLSPVNVTKNMWLGGDVFVSNENELSSITIVWGSSSNIIVEELFTIRFRINDDAPMGHSYISLYVIDLMDASRTDIAMYANSGVINILQANNWGNVTETGYVHVGDLTRLAQHLAAIPGQELSDRALYLADVDRDGKVTVADLILIAQHLADPYNFILGVPQ